MDALLGVAVDIGGLGGAELEAPSLRLRAASRKASKKNLEGSSPSDKLVAAFALDDGSWAVYPARMLP